MSLDRDAGLSLAQDVRMSRAIVVVPCFNEADRLDVDRLKRFVSRTPSVHLLFVNDGSRDDTAQVLRGLTAAHPQCMSCLDLPENVGKAEAVRRGLLMALGKSPQYVGFWDADLATPLDDIPGFCRVLDEKPQIEVVIGVRLPLAGHVIERRPLRKIAGRVFSQVAGLVLGVGLCDTQCGAKLFRAGPQWGELLTRPFLTRWIFDVELFARWIAGTDRARAGLAEAVYEYPLDRWCDVAGSKLKGRDFVKAFGEMARIYWAYMRPGLLTPAVRARLTTAGRSPEVSARGMTKPGPQTPAQPEPRRRAA